MSVRLALAGPLALTMVTSAAAALRVTPISVDRVAPAARSKPDGVERRPGPDHAQVRIFRWRQSEKGAEILEPTEDVIVSPPILKLVPGTDYTVRIVRISKTPVAGEEAYRIFADELPARIAALENTVKLLVRYSIPVFFSAAGAKPASVTWTAKAVAGRLLVQATNHGARRLRISQLRISRGREPAAVLVGGLAGYVLGDSTMTWGPRRPAHSDERGSGDPGF